LALRKQCLRLAKDRLQELEEARNAAETAPAPMKNSPKNPSFTVASDPLWDTVWKEEEHAAPEFSEFPEEKDLSSMTPKELRRHLQDLGITPTSWDPAKLMAQIEGGGDDPSLQGNIPSSHASSASMELAAKLARRRSQNGEDGVVTAASLPKGSVPQPRTSGTAPAPAARFSGGFQGIPPVATTPSRGSLPPAIPPIVKKRTIQLIKDEMLEATKTVEALQKELGALQSFHLQKEEEARKALAEGKDASELLWNAAFHGHILAATMLLEQGADKNHANADGVTSLHVGAENGHNDIVKLLLDVGSDIDKVDSDSTTPLYVGSQNGHAEVVELLLKAGADKDMEDADGFTPMYAGAENGHAAVVKLLLDAGADKKKATDGWTPLRVASDQGHRHIVALLR